MDVEVVFVLDVVASELAKAVSLVSLRHLCVQVCYWSLLSLIPGHNVAETNLPQPSRKGKDGEEDGGKDGLPLLEVLDETLLL